MNVRRLQKKDVPAVQSLALKAWLSAYKNIYSEKRIRKEVAAYYATPVFNKLFPKLESKQELFLIVEEKRLLGYAHIARFHKSWELLRIYVEPNLKRRGIGSALLRPIESFLRAVGAKSYVAYPHANNPVACAFYEKKGFVRNKRKDRAKTDICYEKEL